MPTIVVVLILKGPLDLDVPDTPLTFSLSTYPETKILLRKNTDSSYYELFMNYSKSFDNEVVKSKNASIIEGWFEYYFFEIIRSLVLQGLTVNILYFRSIVLILMIIFLKLNQSYCEELETLTAIRNFILSFAKTHSSDLVFSKKSIISGEFSWQQKIIFRWFYSLSFIERAR